MTPRLLPAALLLLPLFPLQAQSRARTPVLVELFTSEGCSSCPPADALLARLEHDQPIPSADIIVLSEHVDYWDSLGWRDRFSSHQYTDRQSAYSTRLHLADVYTPQMVVAGRTQFIGSDAGAAARAIVQAALKPGLPLIVSDLALSGTTLSATLTLSTPAPAAELFAALVTPEESTQVHAGENGGRTLHHVGVVRSLTRIGNTHDLAQTPIHLRLDAPPRATRLVVFAQSPDLGPVLGIVSKSIPSPHAETVAQARK